MSSTPQKPAAIAPHVPLRVTDVLGRSPSESSCEVAGWVRSRRTSKQVAFLAVNDGSSPHALQVVVPLDGAQAAALNEVLARIQTGASVRVRGRLQASPGGQQAVELVADDVEVLGEASGTDYPLQKKGHTLEFLRGISHLRSRSNTFAAVFRLRARLAQATHTFFSTHGFHYVHTPLITTSDCEGAGEMFEVTSKSRGDLPFFGKSAYLTVSGQLAGESLAYGLGRIYTFGPTFRAENSNTTRHLAEFWMIEPEMAFFDLAANMDLAEAYVSFAIQQALDHHLDDLTFLQKHYEPTLIETLQTIAQKPAARMTYTRAIEVLQQAKTSFATPVAWGQDLQSEHERYLCEVVCQGPVFLTDYPKAIKAFYMYENDDEKTVAAMDLLVPRLGELIGGSQREHRTERLRQRLLANLRSRQVPDAEASLHEYDWYLDQNKFGGVPHAGFGLGFERLVMLVTGMANIRDTIAFPRAPDLAMG